MTDAVAMQLLGARHVVACDYNPILNRTATRLAVLTSQHPDKLKWREDQIIYKAPIDYAAAPLTGEQFDLIFSRSVLEHIPPSLLSAILGNLTANLKPGGTMLHIINLEDHMDSRNAPFEFFTRGTNYDAQTDYDRRGNRMTLQQWRDVKAPGVEVTFENVIYRQEKQPTDLLPEFVGTRSQLFASRITMIGRKSQ
jgi:hypothetical protein